MSLQGMINKFYKTPDKITGFAHDGVWNSIAVINGKNYRYRVECLIIRDNEIFLAERPDGTLIVPGGSVEKNVPNEVQCANECKEESRIIIKNVKYSGVSYTENTGMARWAIEKNLPITWVGKYTEVYIAEYDRLYSGHIDEHDIDPVNRDGKFYDINSVYSQLKPEWKQALRNLKIV